MRNFGSCNQLLVYYTKQNAQCQQILHNSRKIGKCTEERPSIQMQKRHHGVGKCKLFRMFATSPACWLHLFCCWLHDGYITCTHGTFHAFHPIVTWLALFPKQKAQWQFCHALWLRICCKNLGKMPFFAPRVPYLKYTLVVG